MDKNKDIKVFFSNRDSICGECGEELGRGDFITLTEDRNRRPLCLTCSDLDHLIYLPSGDAALTRRARKYSILSAVVLKFSKARKRNERQGLLVEPQALEKSECECLADNEVRARRRERVAKRRKEMDRNYVKQFAERVRELFPGCPPGREVVIAEHACLKYSGRVGRSAAAKEFSEYAVRLAVIAHIRHAETEYDQYLADYYDRQDAREQVKDKVDSVLSKWRIP